MTGLIYFNKDDNFILLWMRADPPSEKARTYSTVAMLVSPGKVVSICTMCPTQSHSSIWLFSAEQTIKETGCESIPAANPVKNRKSCSSFDQGMF
jgi:hypothetical protein